MPARSRITPLPTGHYTMPADGPRFPGERIVVTAFLVEHPRGRFLFDTGGTMANARANAQYAPVHFPRISAVLAEHNLRTSDIAMVANCHFHSDHSGGNHEFPRTPIFVQRAEVAHLRTGADESAHAPSVADFAGARLEEIDGEAEPLDGIRIVPTPGHTPGHQSLVVETKRGRVILAGQALSFSSDYARHRYAHELAARGEPHGPYPEWIARFAEFDPWRVYFAHDRAHWQRDALAPIG